MKWDHGGKISVEVEGYGMVKESLLPVSMREIKNVESLLGPRAGEKFFD